MHFYAVEIYIGKINFICETDREFLHLQQHKNRRTRCVVCVELEKLSFEKQNPWDWLLCGGRTCVPGRWNASVRSTREWKDGQTDSEVSHLHQTTNSFELFFCEHARCSATQKKILEFNLTGTWISVFVRAWHCYFLSWARSIHLHTHFLYRQHTCLTLPFHLHLSFLISIFASLLLIQNPLCISLTPFPPYVPHALPILSLFHYSNNTS
jgi:hypothetical protein